MNLDPLILSDGQMARIKAGDIEPLDGWMAMTRPRPSLMGSDGHLLSDLALGDFVSQMLEAMGPPGWAQKKTLKILEALIEQSGPWTETGQSSDAPIWRVMTHGQRMAEYPSRKRFLQQWNDFWRPRFERWMDEALNGLSDPLIMKRGHRQAIFAAAAWNDAARAKAMVLVMPSDEPLVSPIPGRQVDKLPMGEAQQWLALVVDLCDVVVPSGGLEIWAQATLDHATQEGHNRRDELAALQRQNRTPGAMAGNQPNRFRPRV